jgi:hypothetical protein
MVALEVASPDIVPGLLATGEYSTALAARSDADWRDINDILTHCGARPIPLDLCQLPADRPIENFLNRLDYQVIRRLKTDRKSFALPGHEVQAMIDGHYFDEQRRPQPTVVSTRLKVAACGHSALRAAAEVLGLTDRPAWWQTRAHHLRVAGRLRD